MSETNGINGHKSTGLQWKAGLVTSTNTYLTAEKFGFKVNASGTALKNKQIWTLEQDLNEEVVYIRSFLGRYLSSDKYGNVTCEAEEPGPSEKFAIEYAKGTGKWLFRQKEHGNYLGNSGENVKCFAKSPGDCESWTVQLSIHPQVHLRNVNRKRYGHLKDDELQCTEVIPWGQDALIILEFVEGKYALKTFDNRYLHKDGGLVEALDDSSKFTLEIKSGQISGLAFKDNDGRYLTAVGSTASMKGRNKTVTKDELFTIEESHPQVLVIAHNGKLASIKQGIDVTANQEEETDRETFQMEYNRDTDSWAFRTIDNKYWALEPTSAGVQAKSTSITPNALFGLEWQGDGTVALKASNNSYIFNKATGSLVAASDTIGEKEKFKIRIVNRPLLVLKCEFGFVGVKVKSEECCCNRVTYDLIQLQGCKDGTYTLKASNGKFFSIADNDLLMLDGDGPTPFIIEFMGNSKMTIRAPNGNLLKTEQNGQIKANGTEVNASTLLEF
ncbi:fascin-like [Saccostrea echinata]|uniref:fascin-like n=1 Tax=Saccostrea echinata TaxID=191078 RepID=UPI002A833E09|nr:fascin-like [Saccostrea echinata]